MSSAVSSTFVASKKKRVITQISVSIMKRESYQSAPSNYQATSSQQLVQLRLNNIQTRSITKIACYLTFLAEYPRDRQLGHTQSFLLCELLDPIGPISCAFLRARAIHTC